MSGLRPVAAFFIVLTAIAWIMVAISVAKIASVPPDTQSPDTQSYNGVPDTGTSAGSELGLSIASLEISTTPGLPPGSAR